MDYNIFYIYCHHNKINGKKYIGQTKNLKERWVPSHYKGCRAFYNAIQKYGWENFEHIILEENLTLTEANQKEKEYIQMYNTQNPNFGYNLTSGGKNGIHSKETKKLISDHHADFSGANHPLYGKHHSAETKEKIRQARLGKSFLSEEKRKEISKKFKGGNNPNAKRILCVETNEIFSCAKEAAKKLGVDNSTLSKAARQHKKYKGYHWEYLPKTKEAKE